MNKLTRYNAVDEMVEHPSGDYVLATGAEAHIEELRGLMRELAETIRTYEFHGFVVLADCTRALISRAEGEAK